MAKLTRKLWVGIGAATHRRRLRRGRRRGAGHPQGPPAAGTPPARTRPPRPPTQGGEAYLTDGGPRDTRIRFYRDIALMRGHSSSAGS